MSAHLVCLELPEGLPRGVLAEVARRVRIPYMRLWRARYGGARLSQDELARVNEALKELGFEPEN